MGRKLEIGTINGRGFGKDGQFASRPDVRDCQRQSRMLSSLEGDVSNVPIIITLCSNVQARKFCSPSLVVTLESTSGIRVANLNQSVKCMAVSML